VKFSPVKEIAPKFASADFQNICRLVSKKCSGFFRLRGNTAANYYSDPLTLVTVQASSYNSLLTTEWPFQETIKVTAFDSPKTVFQPRLITELHIIRCTCLSSYFIQLLAYNSYCLKIKRSVKYKS